MEIIEQNGGMIGEKATYINIVVVVVVVPRFWNGHMMGTSRV
jgi:hypothetical protein